MSNKLYYIGDEPEVRPTTSLQHEHGTDSDTESEEEDDLE